MTSLADPVPTPEPQRCAPCQPAGPAPLSLRQPEPSGSFSPPLLWGGEGLRAAAPGGTPWLWQGFLAPGAVTLLTSHWKAGKTTLVAVLLARLKTGGQLAGLPLAAGRAVVISEESPAQWEIRHRQLDFGDHVGWFCRPFRGKPRPDQWLALLDRLAELHARHALSLVVIDPLAAFLPGRTENDAAGMLEALTLLQRLTAAGMAILLAHHPRREKSPAGQASRGSGALPGFADILLEMRRYRRAGADDRRRKLQAFSRFPDTPRQLVIELNPEGTDYVGLGSFQEEEFAASWQTLRAVLEEAPAKLTRRDIHRHWPGGSPPELVGLYRLLERAVEQGLVRKDGRGLRGHPFRYWLPSREAVWLQDPLAFLHMPELFQPVSPPTDAP